MRILVFTPYASCNGAEMMLLNILKHADKGRFEFGFFSPCNGPLTKEIPDHVNYFAAPDFHSAASKPGTDITHYLARLRSKVKNKTTYWLTGKYPAVQSTKPKPYKDQIREYLTQVHQEFKPDIWYINTVLMSDVTELASELNIPFAIHVHDMLYMYTQVGYAHMKNMIQKADLLIGCAECVCDKLRIMGGQRVVLQYECVDLQFRDELKFISQEEARKKHGIPTDKYVWIMSGAVEYRKGIDLLPELAQLAGDRVHIICLGEVYSGYGYYIEQELKYYHIDNVTISGFKKEDYYEYMLLADGFVLTSREDPFPLVMIEAASLGLPIASFDSGGVKEFVEEGMGIVVDTNQVEDLAEAMRKIMDGEAGIIKEKILARAEAFDAIRQTSHWEKLMVENCLNEPVQII